ncbi:MAG: nuclear transport factor 2 family protein, partial [Sphingomonadaceae bacterium]|nr:nuclear transport factor 2 family protein [Sphingomonadaceae bacterium]
LARDFPVDGRHLTTDLIIDVDGDEAVMKNYMLYLDMGPPCEVSMFGVYFDKLVRTPSGWKFKERIFEPHTIRASETSAEFMSVVEAAAR